MARAVAERLPNIRPFHCKAVARHRDVVQDAGMLADQYGATPDRLEPWGPLRDEPCLRFSAALGPFICATDRRGKNGA